MPSPKKKRKVTKRQLTKKQKTLVSKFIGEEVRTRKYPRKQAVAIGISRAIAKTKLRAK